MQSDSAKVLIPGRKVGVSIHERKIEVKIIQEVFKRSPRGQAPFKGHIWGITSKPLANFSICLTFAPGFRWALFPLWVSVTGTLCNDSFCHRNAAAYAKGYTITYRYPIGGELLSLVSEMQTHGRTYESTYDNTYE
jgi:hypothetical protein